MIVALLAVTVAFPLIHEAGHAFFALLSKGELKEFRLFPIPCVLCGVSGLNGLQTAFIGSGGTVLCFLFSVILGFRKNFFLWFFSFCFKGMSALSLAVSLASLLLLPFGICLENEDVVIMLSFWSWGFFPITAALVLLLSCTIIMIRRQHFFQRLLAFFDVPGCSISLAKNLAGKWVNSQSK